MVNRKLEFRLENILRATQSRYTRTRLLSRILWLRRSNTRNCQQGFFRVYLSGRQVQDQRMYGRDQVTVMLALKQKRYSMESCSSDQDTHADKFEQLQTLGHV